MPARNVILQPVGGGAGPANLARTVDTWLSLDAYADVLPAGAGDALRRLLPDGRFHAWGTPDANQAAFERMGPGDVVLFYAARVFNAGAVVLAGGRSPGFGLRAWGDSSFSNVYFFG